MATRTRIDARYEPLYTPADISKYAHVHPETLRTWTKGPGAPLLIPSGAGVAPYSFINLIEAHVLIALRKTYKVPMQRIRKQANWLRKKFHTEHPLAERNIETDGYSLFIEHMGLKLSAAGGQIAIPEVVSLYLRRVERDPRGPARFYPFTTWVKCPSLIVMSPFVDFGRPVISGTRVETVMIRERFDAGESVRALADDYDVSEEAIEEALRCEPERRAA